MPIDYAALRRESSVFPDWKTLINSDLSFPENLLALVKRTIVLPYDFYDIVCSYFLIPSALASVVPYLFLWGTSGSGKTTLAKLASHVHGIAINSSSDTFAAIRNELEEKRWTQEGTEKNAFMVWDDIDPSVFTTRPDIYRLFKFGYDRSTDTISISSDKAGKNLKFRCFCPKIFSSVSPLHTDSNFPELKRRLLTIKTKRLEDFDSSDRERMGMLVGDIHRSQLIDLNLVNWDGMSWEFKEFWGLEMSSYYLQTKKIIADYSTEMTSQQRVVSLDLITTGITTGIWSDEDVAFAKVENYWSWFARECKDSGDALSQLLEQVSSR
jgi:hypothetical protein